MRRHGNDGFIREVQNMLRTVGYSTGERCLIIPENGIFDAATETALACFRELHGLGDGGVLDEATYNALSDAYCAELFRRGPTAAVRPYPERDGYELSLGEHGELVLILQLMLGSLALYYDLPRVAPSGAFDDETYRAVCDFQRASALPVTGSVDRYTWERLAEEYNETVNYT